MMVMMMMVKRVFFLMLCLVQMQGVMTAEVHWCYTNSSCAPATWSINFPTLCNSTSRQSPVNINSSAAVPMSPVDPLSLYGWNATAGQNWTVTNNGHSVSVSLPGNLSVSGGALNGTYLTDSFHFHWGAPGNQSTGSEHAIDGVWYPLEMHIINYKQSYGNVSAAKNYPDGLAVFGVFFQVGGNFSSLDSILAALSNISRPGMNSSVMAPSLQSFVPGALESSIAGPFYRYSGSLTTPTCDESVIWSVFQAPLFLGQAQLDLFRTLLYYDAEGKEPLVNNFRPIQNLGSRAVYYTGTANATTTASTNATTTASTNATTNATTLSPATASPTAAAPGQHPPLPGLTTSLLILASLLTWAAGAHL
uniref:Carbonic anhydrase n=1 Tax=Petromyzon marinus TaxID=7757 RepID=A0AAJ7UI90_PETMA|nr:carbonic anhydrase 2-like [Petromyzon marinus]